MTARRLLLGDWTAVVRDPVDLLRATLPAGAVVFFLTGEVGLALRLALTGALAVVPRLIDVPRPFDLAFVVGMLLQAGGHAFHLFEDLSFYDRIVHSILPLATAPLLYLVLIRLDAVPDLTERTHARRDLGIFIITMSIGITVGALYEVYEFAAVNLIGAGLLIGYADTIYDLLTNSVSSAIGAALLVVWGRAGWGTTRRVPARRLPG